MGINMEIDKIVILLNRITRFYLSCRIHSKEAVKYGNNLHFTIQAPQILPTISRSEWSQH